MVFSSAGVAQPARVSSKTRSRIIIQRDFMATLLSTSRSVSCQDSAFAGIRQRDGPREPA
ncbi:MAG: hypothetical protein V3V46_06580, partial [Anaerolineales bacterium]